jgi:hypothetical protein
VRQLTNSNLIRILVISDFSGRLRSRTEQTTNGATSMINTSEELRLRYLYRRLILDGKIALSFESAKKIIGPDCAYHLYSVQGLKKIRKRKFSW